ncbi:MAG: serine protease [Roseburia sp.]|nr:serine protease [Roseburia sp.]MCM1098791.1 serine protease [Ruminococcus flavefaciens]
MKRIILFYRKLRRNKSVRQDAFLWLAAVCLLLGGCAGNSETEWESSDTEGQGAELPGDAGISEAEYGGSDDKNPEGGIPGEAAGAGETVLGLLAEMEPLQWTDSENENLADLLQRQGGGCMVQVGAGGSLGSGVIYGEEQGELLILTAAHVLEEAEDGLRVTFFDGLSVICDDFVCFDLADLGLLRVPETGLQAENLEQYARVKTDQESFDAVRQGDSCIVMGSRAGVAAEAYEGTILDGWIFLEDYDQYMMWVRAEAKPGMSGGGLFDSRGYFLGILSGGSGDGELAVVPLSLIRAALGEIY